MIRDLDTLETNWVANHLKSTHLAICPIARSAGNELPTSTRQFLAAIWNEYSDAPHLMKLCKLTRLNELKSRQKVFEVMTMLWMYRRDPKANDFLQYEAELILRKVMYHMRQATSLHAWSKERRSCKTTPSSRDERSAPV